MIGPALEIIADGLEAEVKGDGKAISTHHEQTERASKNENKQHGSIVHHFKLTETRIREGEYQETTDDNDTHDKVTSKTEDDNKSKKCGCFGWLRAGKAKK